MDSLTNIYNRYGFDELAEEMIAKNPNAHYVVALFDIDDFKFINDIYGHVYGDRALKNLADSMKKSFPSDALLGRNGGDEFCILLPNRTYDDAKEQLQQFIDVLAQMFHNFNSTDRIEFFIIIVLQIVSKTTYKL